VWRLVVEGGVVKRVEEPALSVPRGRIGVKVKAFLLDDFSQWVLRRGWGPLSRWALGVVVAGGEVGRYVVAYAENAAAQYIAADRYVYVGSGDPSALEAAAVAYVVEALRRVPRFARVEVLGDDPRRAALERLAEVGPSRWRVALSGASVGGGRVVALSRLVELVGNCRVYFVDVPSRWALERAASLGLRLGLPVRRLGGEAPGDWAVVLVD
jgi:hypothetical protein